MDIEINHNQENRKFHTYIDNSECYLRYTILGPTMLEYCETFVPPLLRRQKIATQIVEKALEYAYANNFMVIPSCSFVASYIHQHPKYEKIRARNLDKLI